MENRNWREYKFSEFVNINPSVSLKANEEYSFVEMKDLEDGNKYCFPKIKKIKGGGAKFQNGDTLFARITPCLENGKICQVKGLENNLGFGSTEFYVFRGKEDISDTEFVYYLSRWNDVRDHAEINLDGTSGRQRVPKASFDDLQLIMPPLSEQKAIASVLSSLDDKIDLLHQQNQTLEALAETLFRQWFIEEAKEDWEEVPLKDLVKLLQGKYVSAEKISEAINLDRKFPLYGGNGIRGYLNTYQFKERKVAITCRGNGCGLIQLLNPFSNISNSCIVLNNDENLSIWFIYYYSKTLDFFSVTSGSAQPQITITDIGTLNITIPDIEILVKFDKIVKSYHDKIFENQQQIQTLTQLRNTLLPKLMSGEVRVKM